MQPSATRGKIKTKTKITQEQTPSYPKLQIKVPLQAEILPQLRALWAREQDKNKEHVIAQFKETITTNRKLFSYQSIVTDSWDNHDSNLTANTQNSEGIFVFQANTEFNANASVNSNGEIRGTSNLIVNAVASKSILQKE